MADKREATAQGSAGGPAPGRRAALSRLATWATLPALAGAPGTAGAQSRTLRLVAPFPAGGSTDILARGLGERLGAMRSQTAVVENQPGANGALGTQAVARAAPDGQTLLVHTNAGIVINPLLYKTLANPMEALAPVAQLVELELVLAVRADTPVRSLAEFVEQARARPGGMTYASVGAGSLSHLAGEAFRLASGVPMLHVPYKGAAPALNDLLGGQVDCYFGTPPTFLAHVRAGKLRVLANTAADPSPWFAGVPRVADLYAGFEAVGWQGVFAPVTTPAAALETLERQVLAALTDEGWRRQLADQGMRVTGRPGRELSALMRREQSVWARLIERAKITVH
jgi:tripartite-type tricarboxylate transporter receptor subunit TctC